MIMPLTIFFPGGEQTTHSEVGGKGYSLIQMAQAGLPVPPGAVLTTGFFVPWFDEIKATGTWHALTVATPDMWPTLCNTLKARSASVELTATQRRVLEDLQKTISAPGGNMHFAVRSSSPEEDLASASFAGGYETRLGVSPDNLEDAIRHCFASSLDERVLVYKKEHGFDALSPSIAVVVQQQIDSEVAGVGFSLNPLTNDYDEAVIDANWGLGESVVAGLASFDHFVVDKVGQRVIEKTPGAKQISVWASPDGGTIERKGHRSTEQSLNDDQLRELTDTLCLIEALYGRPMDVEWAYAEGHLFVLQARPITRYVPLAPEMVTRPGERRRLYADAALAKGMTLNAPISPLGLAWLEDLMLSLIKGLQTEASPEKGLIFAAGSRLYMNLSFLMRLTSVKRLARSTASTNSVLAGIMANIDENRYRAARRPRWMVFRILGFVPRMLWLYRWTFLNIFHAILSPQRARRAYQHKVDAYEKEFTESVNHGLPLEEFRRVYTARLLRSMFDVTIPALIAGQIPADLFVRKNTAEARALAEKLKMGFDGNVVVEMGVALFQLAKLLDRADLEDLPGLTDRIRNRRLSAEFLSAWDVFVSRFGCRGPLEMDMASPRYADDPGLALRQMSFMVGDQGFDPDAAHARNIEERQRAYAELMSRSGWFRRVLLQRMHTVSDLFAGTRDTPKHHVVQLVYALRRRALIEGHRLVEEERLDTAEDVFGLTFHDLEAATYDATLDLREVRDERTRFLTTLKAHVTEFPNVIDSRGRILRPPPSREKAGEMRGVAVSPGVVTGRVKVLRNPYEKSVDKGDILVAYTTDPGWTPLFVNAAAVLLEVGGVLQHGAVIAREYGKPCVVGIDGLIARLQDGQTVEVDGTAGIVRLVS